MIHLGESVCQQRSMLSAAFQMSSLHVRYVGDQQNHISMLKKGAGLVGLDEL